MCLLNERRQWPICSVSLVAVYSLPLYLLLACPGPWLQETRRHWPGGPFFDSEIALVGDPAWVWNLLYIGTPGFYLVQFQARTTSAHLAYLVGMLTDNLLPDSKTTDTPIAAICLCDNNPYSLDSAKTLPTFFVCLFLAHSVSICSCGDSCKCSNFYANGLC